MEEKVLIGTLLKTQREHLSYDIRDIASKTKINLNILKSLEDNDLKGLPNKTYVKGFVKSYAKTLGLMEEDVLESLEFTYSEIFGANTEEEKKQPAKLGSLQSNNHEETENEEMKETFISIIQGFLNKKVLYSIAIIFVFLLIGKGIVTFFTNLNVEKETITTETQSEIKDEDANLLEMDANKKMAEQVVAADEATAKKESEDLATKKLEEEKKAQEAAKLEEEKKASEAKKLEEEKKALAAKKAQEDKEEEEEEVAEEKAPEQSIPAGKLPFKKFYPAPIKMYDIVASSPEANDPDLLPPAIKSAMIEGKQNIYINATIQDTWISYKVDDEPIKRYVLKQGRRVLIKGEKVLLFMGNFNAAKVFYNNELITANTRTGVKSMIFPQEIAKDYELPLFPSYKGVPYTANEYKEKMVEKQ